MNRNTVFVAAMMVFMYACGDSANKTESAKPTAAAADTTPPPAPTLKNGISQADYDKGLSLVAKSDCLTCHKIGEKFVGPAYRDVANKYTANPDTIDMLASKIIKGGAGRWGQVPMTPHPTISKEDAAQMVKYVLTIE